MMGEAAMVTGCGRQVVVLRIDPDGDCCETVRVSLTAAEALRLAEALMGQAQAVAAGA
jgi:hypothetical protein